MAGALDHPMLEHGPAGRVGMGGAAVAPSADSLALLRRGRRLQAGGRGVASLADDLVAVAGMDRPVQVAVEHDGRHHPLLCLDRLGWIEVAVAPFCMAAKADGMSLAAPAARPEWTPTAA